MLPDSQPRRVPTYCAVMIAGAIFLALSWCWQNPARGADHPLGAREFCQMLHTYLLAAAAESSLKERPFSPSDARAAIRKHLGRNLLVGVREIEAADFVFVLPGQQTESQAAILVLGYPEARTALDRWRRFAAQGDYFQHTIILTRLYSLPVGKWLIVVFTEKAGDAAVVSLLNGFVAQLKEDTGGQPK